MSYKTIAKEHNTFNDYSDLQKPTNSVGKFNDSANNLLNSCKNDEDEINIEVAAINLKNLQEIYVN